MVVASGNTITAVTPANPAGPVNVTVTNPDGQSSTLAVVLTPLSNAGFESGSSGWIWNSSGAATIITNSAQAHGGNNFLQLTSQPTNLPSYGAILGTGSSWSSQFLPVNPGDKITFGGWITRVSGDGFARWTIAVADSNQSNSTYVSTANATANVWTLVQATYTIPAGKAFIRFYAEVYNNTIPAQSNFDDAILQRQLAVGGYTYLVASDAHIHRSEQRQCARRHRRDPDGQQLREWSDRQDRRRRRYECRGGERHHDYGDHAGTFSGHGECHGHES